MEISTHPSTARRRIVYVDRALQKWLLITLVTFEVLLISGALWMLYLQLNSLLEANIYRIHFTDSPHVYPLLLNNAVVGICGLVAINLILLLVADRLWARHINSILQPLNALLTKVEELDFSEDVGSAIPATHKVIDLAYGWRKSERQRLLKLREEISRLDALGDLSTLEAQASARAALENILKLLP